MSNSISKELALVKELLNEGKYEEALRRIKDIEENKNVTPEEMLRALSYKGKLYFFLGQFEIVFKIAEELYQKSQKLEMPLFSLDALYLKEGFFAFFARADEFNRSFEQHQNIFKSIQREESLKFQEREIEFLYMNAVANHWDCNYNLALDYFNECLLLIEQFDPRSHYKYRILGIMAWAYLEKGELKLALEHDEKALNFIPKGEYFYPMWCKASIYRNKGIIFYQRGDLNNALKFYTRSLEIYEKIKSYYWIYALYYNIIEVLLAQKNYNQVNNYLHKSKQLNERSQPDHPFYQLSKGLILKSSTRMHDRVDAEKILKKIIEEDVVIRITNYALIYLCNWYFEEFRLSHQMEILNDIFPLIDHLLRNAEYSNSYSTLANTKLLQAKLALLQINMVDARKLLTEAQNLADKYDLQLLAGEISREHDRLLEELELWESIKKTQASASERLELASVDKVIERLQGRRALEPLESSGQQPVSLLILAAGGVLLLSYPFTDEWKQDDDLFGSFLSAFLTFSDEFFSQGLDRAKFGEETILLQSVGSFSICYLFRGQTYFAKQKLEKFVETIQKDPEIWNTLEKFEKSSQVAELKDLPKMEGLLNEIFLN